MKMKRTGHFCGNRSLHLEFLLEYRRNAAKKCDKQEAKKHPELGKLLTASALVKAYDRRIVETLDSNDGPPCDKCKSAVLAAWGMTDAHPDVVAAALDRLRS